MTLGTPMTLCPLRLSFLLGGMEGALVTESVEKDRKAV